MPGAIVFNSINANGMETNAAIFVGENVAHGWDSNNKNQLAVGMLFTSFGAFAAFPYSYNVIFDNDFFDTIINDTDIEGGSALQGP
jgi:hypothetical protein